MTVGTTPATTRVETALAALREGRMVLVVDDASRENEGDLVAAAQHMEAASVNAMISEGRGLLCVAIAGSIADRLGLAQMVERNTDTHGTAFTVSVDAVSTGTGISATDRAATVRALASPRTLPQDLRRPGHVFPLRAMDGGVLQRRGHTEAAVELTRLAGLGPAAAICEVLDDEGWAADRAHLTALAGRLDIPILDVADIVEHVRGREEPFVGARMPTRYGVFTATGHRDPAGTEHIALVMGDLADDEAPLVRVHSECLTGDVLGSQRCDCGDQLELAMSTIAEHGAGVVLYMRGHEGRGIGLVEKLRAYALQDTGWDTVDANLLLGHPVDARDYRPAADILRRLGIGRLTLLSNNPAKADGLQAQGMDVAERVPLVPAIRPDNRAYLQTKRNRLGHTINVPEMGPCAVPDRPTSVPCSPPDTRVG
ncbi:GTP cyclohydrolase II [Streptomyces sp. NBC_00988]|uniref:GTP cyclohydrolase II n=1 Tax=Streptomyces sp. NBC_00988 TaxID=2903704 RepID=UPI00386E8212|nr:GTP cyclohydrolase II [Streptomyces sp. NBC_00988]